MALKPVVVVVVVVIAGVEEFSVVVKAAEREEEEAAEAPEVAERNTGGEKDLGVALPTTPRLRCCCCWRNGVEEVAGDAGRKDDEASPKEGTSPLGPKW